MGDLPSIPNSISHKKLFSLLGTATKKKIINDSPTARPTEKVEEFKDLIEEWSKISTEVLKSFEENDRAMLEGISRNQAMALGVLQAHLRMALQAKSASDKE